MSSTWEDWASYTDLGLGLGPLDLGMAHMELGLDMAYSIILLGNTILLWLERARPWVTLVPSWVKDPPYKLQTYDVYIDFILFMKT